MPKNTIKLIVLTLIKIWLIMSREWNICTLYLYEFFEYLIKSVYMCMFGDLYFDFNEILWDSEIGGRIYQ